MLPWIAPEDPDHPQARGCIAAYAALLRVSLPGLSRAHLPDGAREAADYRPPGGAFLLARQDGRAVGCVALRAFGPEEGEIKRLWVAPEARRQGLARRLLAAAEETARGLGMRRLRLDTNGALTAALALYRSAGWTEIPPYSGAPATHWFAKDLGDPPAQG